MSNSIIKLHNIQKSYKEGENTYQILKGINLELKEQEVSSLIGASGSGKTTLLNIIGLLDNFNEGSLVIGGIECEALNEKQKSNLRKNQIGFIFQFHHLLADFTVLENVLIPELLLNKENKSNAIKKAENLLTEVGLKNKFYYYPSEISGGEKQRVAIARALINNPKLIIADEPTGNLDPSLSQEICDLIIKLVKARNGAAIIATHNLNIAARANKQLSLSNGILTYI